MIPETRKPITVLRFALTNPPFHPGPLGIHHAHALLYPPLRDTHRSHNFLTPFLLLPHHERSFLAPPTHTFHTIVTTCRLKPCGSHTVPIATSTRPKQSTHQSHIFHTPISLNPHHTHYHTPTACCPRTILTLSTPHSHGSLTMTERSSFDPHTSHTSVTTRRLQPCNSHTMHMATSTRPEQSTHQSHISHTPFSLGPHQSHCPTPRQYGFTPFSFFLHTILIAPPR